MFAVIKTGGKQYKVQAKDQLKIEKLEVKEGETLVFDQVLIKGAGEKVEIGTPLIGGAKVQAKVLKQGRGKKIEVVKYKSKPRYHKKYGHRQPFTQVEIISI